MLFKALLTLKQKPHFEALLELAKSPTKTQLAVLTRILRDNQDSEFGREHGFQHIDSIATYQERVPICDFEHLRNYIERQRDEGVLTLTSTAPVCYNRTSGTTGVPKDVPVTQTSLDETRNASQLSAYVLARQSDVLRGKLFAVGGPAVEDRSVGGIPIGSASGLLYRQQSRFVRSRYVLPPEVFDIEDIETRYVVMAILGLACDTVTTIATANPSTFVRFCEEINSQIELILRHVADGTTPSGDSNSIPVARNPKRALRLQRTFERKGALNYADIWPMLRGVVTWCGGSCGFALSRLRKLIPSACRIMEFGYNSSEFRGTINLDLERNLCLPTIGHTFFEFVERDDWESGRRNFLGLHELVEDRFYYIFATTSSGLYRYDINDIVEVTGWIHATPTIGFVQKGRGVTNITGEKLSEHQVLEGMSALQDRLGTQPEFFVVLADEENAEYLLCMELHEPVNGDSIAEFFDTSLKRLNVEYESKRKSGRLGPIKFVSLPEGTGFNYRTDLVAAGQRDAQFKYLYLQYLKNTALRIPNS